MTVTPWSIIAKGEKFLAIRRVFCADNKMVPYHFTVFQVEFLATENNFTKSDILGRLYGDNTAFIKYKVKNIKITGLLHV